MSGKERSIVLAVYLLLILGFAVSVTVKFITGGVDLDSFQAQYLGAVALLGGLLIKLPPGSAENPTLTVPVDDLTLSKEAGESVKGN